MDWISLSFQAKDAKLLTAPPPEVGLGSRLVATSFFCLVAPHPKCSKISSVIFIKLHHHKKETSSTSGMLAHTNLPKWLRHSGGANERNPNLYAP
jgi:hypothetical protein